MQTCTFARACFAHSNSEFMPMRLVYASDRSTRVARSLMASGVIAILSRGVHFVCGSNIVCATWNAVQCFAFLSVSKACGSNIMITKFCAQIREPTLESNAMNIDLSSGSNRVRAEPSQIGKFRGYWVAGWLILSPPLVR